MGKKTPSGTNTVTQHVSPPQLLNEGREGYELASGFYKDILRNPPVYEGPRVAGFDPTQEEALGQYRTSFGSRQPNQAAAESENLRTLQGGYRFNDPVAPERDMTIGQNRYGLGQDTYGLGGTRYGLGDAANFSSAGSRVGGGGAAGYQADVKGAKSAYKGDPRFMFEKMNQEEINRQVKAASEPILADLEENVMTQIRDSSQLAGQGATSTRSDIARQKAVEGYGRTVGEKVLAPLMMQQSALSQDFDKAMQGYMQATLEGDAERATKASIAMNEITGRSHDVANQVNAERDIADAEMGIRSQEAASRERIAGAGLQSGERVSSAELRSRERLGEAGLTSEERREAARLLSGEKIKYGDRALMAHEGERDRQQKAVQLSSQLMKDESFRINQLFQSGAISQGQAQRMMDSAREKFEEPLYRQSQAATSLLGASGLGPGSSTTISKTGMQSDTMADVQQGMQYAMMAAKLAGAAGSSIKFKSDITSPPSRRLVEDMLNLVVKQWHYRWEPPTATRFGPILEQSPDWIRESPFEDQVSFLQLLSGLILTVQHLNTRIKELEGNVLPDKI